MAAVSSVWHGRGDELLLNIETNDGIVEEETQERGGPGETGTEVKDMAGFVVQDGREDMRCRAKEPLPLKC